MTDSPLASSEWAGFLHTMRFAPDDDTARLVAADWLQETDRPELVAWADFVRYQIEAARNVRDHVYTDSCDCGVCRPERRAAVLFDKWGYHWFWHQFGAVIDTDTDHPEFKFKASVLGHWARGFLAEVHGTLKPWRLRTIAPLIQSLYAGAHAPLIEINLWEMGLHYPDNTWSMLPHYTLRMTSEPTEFRKDKRGTDLHRVRCEIKRANRHYPRTVSQSRLVSPRNDFLRAVGGAVSAAIKLRNEVNQPAHDLGGES